MKENNYVYWRCLECVRINKKTYVYYNYKNMVLIYAAMGIIILCSIIYVDVGFTVLAVLNAKRYMKII